LRDTPYRSLKRFLYAVPEFSKRINRNEVNTMIQDACEDAYNDLDCIQKGYVRDAKNLLVANVKELGEKGALELLAALGDCMNHKESEVE
jgi:hypothetical protein